MDRAYKKVVLSFHRQEVNKNRKADEDKRVEKYSTLQMGFDYINFEPTDMKKFIPNRYCRATIRDTISPYPTSSLPKGLPAPMTRQKHNFKLPILRHFARTAQFMPFYVALFSAASTQPR